MTTLEERLTEALHVRADQVRAEHLEPAATPAEATPLRRRALLPALAAGVAAALVIVIAVVVVAGQDDGADQQPADRPTATERPTATDSTSSTPGPRPLPKLLPEDDPGWMAEGRDVTFPDGSIATLGRTELSVTFEGSGAGVSLPDYSGAPGSLSRVQLTFAARPLEVPYGHGYLVRHTSGGFDALDVVVGSAGGGLVVVTPNLNSVPFGISPPLYDTWTSENGAGLYTRVRAGSASRRFEVYRWVTVEEGGDVNLRPRSLGTVCLDLEADTYERC